MIPGFDFSLEYGPGVSPGEVQFLQGFAEAQASGPVEATRYLIQTLPEFLGRKMHPKEKMNHLLFLSRIVEMGGKGLSGPRKLLRKATGLMQRIKRHGLPHRKRFVEFGCGVYDPLALSTLFFCNGFEGGTGIDLRGLRNPAYSALSMCDIAANMALFPSRHMFPDASLDLYRQRLGLLDAEALEQGRFPDGFARLQPQVLHQVTDILQSDLRAGEVSLLCSFAVFEHVEDVAGVCAHLYEITAPGGLGFHFVDMADHRSYGEGKRQWYSFLTEEPGPPGVNRMRRSQFVAAFRHAGFEILEEEAVEMDLPDEARKAFLEPWAGMSETDQRTAKLRLTVRKPE